ncbi:hypothetical protein SKAU_G00233320 [Synaphobranchus kaupii]|uniref:Uncharacterized protein n=1 Tax=Synaphobranchus kaupii TaxID=118154 RepID=A0A9Q1F638_SYNKA|nr:hypothetical protein SKAU_G00233320 [Synaphobranchus kaupii]
MLPVVLNSLLTWHRGWLTVKIEKALSILGPTALEGIEGGIDLHGGFILECESGPSNPDTAQHTSGGPSSRPHSPTPQLQPVVSSRPSCPQPSSPVRVGRRREGFSSICGCSQDLIKLEREKLEVLKDLRKVTVEALQQTLRFQEEVRFSKGAKGM